MFLLLNILQLVILVVLSRIIWVFGQRHRGWAIVLALAIAVMMLLIKEIPFVRHWLAKETAAKKPSPPP